METIFHSRILGLDYGKKRIGIAISDPLRITAQPLHTIQYDCENRLWIELDQVIQKNEIEKIVIGLPLNMNGTMGFVAQNVKLFAQKLSDRYQIQVDFWDERLTSHIAEKTIREFGKQPSRIKDKVDKVAATLILQNYLDQKKYA